MGEKEVGDAMNHTMKDAMNDAMVDPADAQEMNNAISGEYRTPAFVELNSVDVEEKITPTLIELSNGDRVENIRVQEEHIMNEPLITNDSLAFDISNVEEDYNFSNVSNVSNVSDITVNLNFSEYATELEKSLMSLPLHAENFFNVTYNTSVNFPNFTDSAYNDSILNDSAHSDEVLEELDEMRGPSKKIIAGLEKMMNGEEDFDIELDHVITQEDPMFGIESQIYYYGNTEEEEEETEEEDKSNAEFINWQKQRDQHDILFRRAEHLNKAYAQG